ncbi:four and a half lim [Anopheles darlingi]|uniref:Four and a half lim n=1 Tax=Anopheles darlingi TaxID=43151 RepID=W5JPU3_ANODA|nr:four and a half lim [Anopheles darlingi]
MAMDILSSDFDSRLRLKTKTVGGERIKRAKDNNEDIAILSMFLPGATAAKEQEKFRCHLGMDCRVGDCRDTTPGDHHNQPLATTPGITSSSSSVCTSLVNVAQRLKDTSSTGRPARTKKMEYKTRQWHEKCFCCCVCKTAIGTKSFIPREQEIYCAGCYEEKYATRCIKCKKIITSGGVTYKNEPWHRECFTCTHCQVSLAGQRFTSRDEKPYCAECFGELFAKRCTSCTKPITGIGGTRFISFEDRHWHNDCFICAICKTSLVGRGFITDEQDVICPECAKQKLM